MTLQSDSLAGAAPPAGIALADFARLSALIEQRCGIQLPDSKRVMVEARLRKRLQQLGLTSFAD